MDVVLHVQRARVSPAMRRRAEALVRRVATRATRPTDASVRFIEDGKLRCVELALHTSSGRRYVARAEGRYFGPVLVDASHRLLMQIDHGKRTRKVQGGARRGVRAGSA